MEKDKLVAWLRSTGCNETSACLGTWHEEAADRIEALESTLRTIAENARYWSPDSIAEVAEKAVR